jgi:hypothetical protein
MWMWGKFYGMRVNLIRKLWKEKVQIPALQRQVDKTLRQIEVKLNNKRSKNAK